MKEFGHQLQVNLFDLMQMRRHPEVYVVYPESDRNISEMSCHQTVITTHTVCNVYVLKKVKRSGISQTLFT